MRASAIVVVGLVCSACQPAKQPILYDRPESTAPATIHVSAASFRDGGTMPEDCVMTEPVLELSGAPKNAKAWIVVVEDPDAPGNAPFVHCLSSSTVSKSEILYGLNSTGLPGYYGPHPPAGPAHHYHFQAFAVDVPINASKDDLATLIPKLKGHVLAKGQIVGLYGVK